MCKREGGGGGKEGDKRRGRKEEKEGGREEVDEWILRADCFGQYYSIASCIVIHMNPLADQPKVYQRRLYYFKHEYSF